MNLLSGIRLLDAIGRNALRLVWAAVLLVILASAGRWFWAQQAQPPHPPKESMVVQPVDWRGVDAAVVDVVQQAKAAARAHAEQGLAQWRAQLVTRIDDDFLEWYFSYWTQQRLGLEGLVATGMHWVSESQADAAEAITATIQSEFANRVLRPPVSQLYLERLARESLDRYVAVLREGLAPLPERYQLPQGEWERYLSGIAVLTHSVDGNRQVDLSLKALTASGVAGSLILAKALGPALAGLGTKVSANMASKGAAVLAAKSGAKVAASSGGKLLGPIVGLGILVWDLWDHHQTREIQRPLLRAALLDYLDEMNHTLLDDPQAGVMGVVYQIEQAIHGSLGVAAP